MNKLYCVFLLLLASQPLPAPGQLTDTSGEVAATVDGDPILGSEVDRELSRVVGDREVAPQTLQHLRRESLQQLIDQRLVVRWMERTKQGASADDVDLAVQRLTKQLKQRETTLDDHLQALNMTEPELRRTLIWRLGWQKVLGRYLTDKNLESYFKRHRREFDGTQVRVSHILFKLSDGSADEALARARKLQEELQTATTTFAEAAREHSDAASAEAGGDIGFIGRHEPMPESFSKAAFALKEDEISPPVTSPFGVHLIQCNKIKPGQRVWQDARDDLKAAVTRYLFDWAAAKERSDTQVRILTAE